MNNYEPNGMIKVIKFNARNKIYIDLNAMMESILDHPLTLDNAYHLQNL